MVAAAKSASALLKATSLSSPLIHATGYARELALRDFGLSRFVNGWNAVFAELTQEVMR